MFNEATIRRDSAGKFAEHVGSEQPGTLAADSSGGEQSGSMLGAPEPDEWDRNRAEWLHDQQNPPPTPDPVYTPPGPPANTHHQGDYYPNVKGSKYTGWRDVASIAKDVRQDIKDAVKGGWLPAEVDGNPVTYSVRTEKFAGGQALRVTVTGLTDNQVYGQRDPDWGNRTLSGLNKELREKLERLSGAYNQSRTEAQVDYFDEMYYHNVDVYDEHRQDADRHEKTMKRLKTASNAARVLGEDTSRYAELSRVETEEYRARVAERNAKETAEMHAWNTQPR